MRVVAQLTLIWKREVPTLNERTVLIFSSYEEEQYSATVIRENC